MTITVVSELKSRKRPHKSRPRLKGRDGGLEGGE